MAKHYSTKDFFRQVPNALLARYFHHKQLLVDFDFAAVKDTRPDELFDAWLDLPDGQRNAIDTEFREIFDLSCEKGFKAIIDEANWQLRERPVELTAFIERLAGLSNHYERAMISFLNYPSFWKGATRFFHADSLQYWRKRKNMSHKSAAVDEDSLCQLADMIRKYFHHTEGRGKNCIVEPFRRGELDYFFAYPEDYSQQSIEWVNGEFDRRPHNPAFEIIYVYSQREGTLDLYYRGSHKAIEPLQSMFATSILKLKELPPDPKDERVYDLAPLFSKGFKFVYPPESGIENVAVKKIRLSSKVKKGDRITLEADTTGNPFAVYDIVDQLRWFLTIRMYNVTQVELAVQTVIDPDKPAKLTTVRLTHPNSCSLKYDEIGLRLRDMLEISGIEPKSLDQPEVLLAAAA
jgi:hypothetical protein